jgi:hypothetical protein
MQRQENVNDEITLSSSWSQRKLVVYTTAGVLNYCVCLHGEGRVLKYYIMYGKRCV